MNQKQSFIQHLNTKDACQNLKEQKFFGFCKKSIFEKNIEQVSQAYSENEGNIN